MTTVGLVGSGMIGGTLATWAEAASAGDLVVVSTPVKAYAGLPAGPFAGKVVMDTGNYYPERDGQLAELDSGALTSSELLARQLPGATVVKVFNNIFFKHLLNLARPAGAVDSESLADGWRQQPGTPAYGPPYGSFDNEKGTPASASVIRAALAGATR